AVAWPLARRGEPMYIVFTLVYALISGLTYAGFSAVVLEAIGRGAAATKYNVYASLSNIPIAYMTVIDGWARTRWNEGAMLYTEAAIGVAALLLFGAVAISTGRIGQGSQQPRARSTALRSRSPLRARARLSSNWRPTTSARGAAAMCGVHRISSRRQSGLSGGSGSVANTSSAAPAS